MKKLPILGLMLLATALIHAQSVPDQVNYQGRLTDDSGQPVASGDYVLEFRIFDDPSLDDEMHLVWGPMVFDGNIGEDLETGHQYKVPVMNGYFNVVLGEDLLGRPIRDGFGAAPRYVEIAVDGEPMWPRQEALSSPFAVSSRSSAKVVGDGNTSISVATAPDTVVDVITVTSSGAEVAGDLDVTGSLDVIQDLDVTGNLNVTGDLTATTAIVTKLTTGSILLPNSSQTENIKSHNGWWGSWRDWVYCPAGSYVCGFRIRLEDGGHEDDTAMNSVEMACCALGTVPCGQAIPGEGGACYGECSEGDVCQSAGDECLCVSE